MKVLLVLLVFLSFTLTSQSLSLKNKYSKPAKFSLEELEERVGIEYCDLCIEFSNEFLQTLLNAVLNIGVAGSCSELCNIVEEKTNSKFADIACNILCDLVGFRAFIAIVNKADLDPIYYCQLLNACPVKDDGDATITFLSITPNKIPRGDDFEITMTYKTVNGTGVTMIALLVDTQDGLPGYTNEVLLPQDPGTYNQTWTGSTQPDPDCEGPLCEQYLPGNYTLHGEMCNGQCGSGHPHTRRYDLKSIGFFIIEQN